MKAYVLRGIGDLRYEDRPVPELRPGWALIRVLAAGICSSDIPRIFTKGTYRFPTIPGHEFCGRVEAVSDGADARWVGKRVGVFPLIPCKKCPSCLRGEYETCEHYDYLGSRRDGGFAEYAAVPIWNLLELPDGVSNAQGALLEPAAVALHAVKRAELRAGARVCIVGTGAIGLLAGQWAKLQGADQVVVKGRNEAKGLFAEVCGLEYTTDAAGEQFDRVIEAVGSEAALAESISLTAPGGRLVLMGNPGSVRTLSQDTYWRILRKQLTLTGTWNSSYGGMGSDWTDALEGLRSNKLRGEAVISHVLECSELMKGLDIMREKRGVYSKIMTNWGAV
mgnify:CR=1 FL=1